MTTTALVRRSDLKRMAEVAKAEGVRVTIEIAGTIITVSPDIPVIHRPEQVDLQPEDFTSLAEWQAWRDRNRDREIQRRP
jgi:hypothetical protein